MIEMEKQTYASTTESELHGRCLDRSTLVTDTVTTLAWGVERRRVVVGGGGLGVVGGHC